MGSILVAAAVAAASDVKATTGQLLLYVASAMAVVWLAHSYAAFVGGGGRVDTGDVGARARRALLTELPMLESATPAVASLAICWAAGVDPGPAGSVGLAVAVTSMVLVAAASARRTGAPPLAIGAAALSSLILGGIIVTAKVAIA